MEIIHDDYQVTYDANTATITYFSMSTSQIDVQKVPRALWERLTDTVCYAT